MLLKANACYRWTVLALVMLALIGAAGLARAQGFGVGLGSSPVAWSLWTSQDRATPGSEIVVAIVAEVSPVPDGQGKHWHFYPREAEHTGREQHTRIASGPYEIGGVQWPEPSSIINAFKKEQPVYEGTVVFYAPVTIPADIDVSEGAVEYVITMDALFQACASSCLSSIKVPLETTVEVVKRERGVTLPDQMGHSVFAGYNPDGGDRALPMGEPDLGAGRAVFDEPSQDAADRPAQADVLEVTAAPGSSISVPFFGEIQTSGALGLLIVVLFAFVGGTVLNLMPCVLPIIPIKIMGLTQATGSRGKSVFLGLMMLLGVMSLWVAIGIAIATLKKFDSVSSLFQVPLFSIGVGLFILVMGVGMMGVFAVRLPQFVYRVNPKHDSPVGAIGFGVMAAVLSTPCTAPFMGASITWATQAESDVFVMAVFIAVGLGMGWPYLVLAAFPQLVARVPRTGPASDVVKQVLGLMMIAAAVFFTGAGVLGLLRQFPFLGPVLYWWLTTAVIGAMAFWLAYRTFQITPSVGRRVLFTAIGLSMFVGMGAFAMSQTQIEHFKHTNTDLWAGYDRLAYEDAREDGSIVIVDFTADW